MKKLIINEKNLPKISKATDSNIRIRINKTQTPHQAPLPKKSIPSQIQDIDICLDTLQKLLSKTITLDDQKLTLLIQILRQYKQVLNPNHELMTQSLKFSKLKFKTIAELQQKQNNIQSPKVQKLPKQISASDRISRLGSISKTSAANMSKQTWKQQKNKKYMSINKRNTQEKQVTKGEHVDKTLSNRVEQDNKISLYNQSIQLTNQLSKQQEQLIQTNINKQESKVQDQKMTQNSNQQQFLTNQQLAQSVQQESINWQQVNVQKRKVSQTQHQDDKDKQLNRQLAQKEQQIKQLHQRIQQLTINIQNLIKKNSLKSQQYNKLQEQHNRLNEQHIQLLQKVNMNQQKQFTSNKNNASQIPNQNNQSILSQVQSYKKRCQTLQQQKRDIEKKKNQLQKEIKLLERQKRQKLQQQLGRYQTAQRFYQLTRKDLKEQNQNLLILLQTRQQQLTNLYQVLQLTNYSQSDTLMYQSTQSNQSSSMYSSTQFYQSNQPYQSSQVLAL